MLFGILTLLTALAIAGVAAWFSIAGLMAIFSAAAMPIAIMAGTLEVGKLLTASWLYNEKFDWFGDMITRFSGITMCCIMTGVIWVGEPESLTDVLLYDNLHVLLWVGGLFFALRGNRA